MGASMSAVGRNGRGRDDWQTPPEFLAHVQDQLGITFATDCASDGANAVCGGWFGLPHYDFLTTPYLGGVGWCNPPFSEAAAFVDRVLALAGEGAEIVLLLPGAMDTKYQHAMLKSPLYRQVFVRGRLSFVHPDTGRPVSGNPVGSVLHVPVRIWAAAGMPRAIGRKAGEQ